jgi:hypothetical protein
VSGWDRARAAHQEAAAHFVSRAVDVPAEAWKAASAPGKWSPAEITEHLSLTYQHLLGELRGGPPARVKGSWLFRLVARYKFLPKLLRDGTVPPGVRAPREVRPQMPSEDRTEALARLQALGVEFEEEITRRRASGGGALTHPYFGALDPDRGIRFVEMHLRHHTRQLPEGAGVKAS